MNKFQPWKFSVPQKDYKLNKQLSLIAILESLNISKTKQISTEIFNWYFYPAYIIVSEDDNKFVYDGFMMIQKLYKIIELQSQSIKNTEFSDYNANYGNIYICVIYVICWLNISLKIIKIIQQYKNEIYIYIIE